MAKRFIALLVNFVVLWKMGRSENQRLVSFCKNKEMIRDAKRRWNIE